MRVGDGIEPDEAERRFAFADDNWGAIDQDAVDQIVGQKGGGGRRAAFDEQLVDRILIYRAPILVGEGKSSVGYIGLDAIADAHGRWRAADGAHLGIDRLEVYERVRDQE